MSGPDAQPRTQIHRVRVEFGDCDPAGIVFFPNFNRWMDQSSLNFFVACGIPPWRELVKTRGIIGTPLLEIHTRFVKSATYGEDLEVHTCVEEWNRKTFRQRHVIRRGQELICEGTELRVFVVRDRDDPERLRSIEVPEDIRQACR